MAIIGYITLTLDAVQDGKTFVSRCRELGVVSCADTAADAIEAVKEATLEYLNTIERLGERRRIFAEKRIAIRKTPPKSPIKREYTLPPGSLTGTFVLPIAA